MTGHELILHPIAGGGLTLDSLAAAAQLHPDLVERYVAYGLVESLSAHDRMPTFELRSVRRLRTICRLRDDLGINLPGIAVVLDLLARIESLRREPAESHCGNREGNN